VNNKYVVAPGSIHPSGATYELVDNAEIVPAPDWLIDWIKQQVGRQDEKRPAESVTAVQDEKILEGGRDNSLFDQACKLRDWGLSTSDALTALRAVNSSRCVPPMPDSVVQAKIESAFKRPARVQKMNEPAHTDLGNAERLVNTFVRSIRYCHELKTWFVWDKRRWTKDDTGQVYRYAKETVKSMLTEASAIQNDNERQALVSHERRSESDQRIRAMVSVAQSEAGIPIRVEELDSDPMRLNCRNGTFDLNHGARRPHNETRAGRI
jgi:putative DNA primase/helicase